jgi:hypothetical protein
MLALGCQEKEVKVVERQIPSGPINVPPPNVPENPDFISLDILEDSILLDLNTLSDIERLNARYLVSCGDYNQGIRDLRSTESATNKAVNSISTESVLENVKPVPPGNCLYRLDLRDYGLTSGEWAGIGKRLLLRFVSDSSRGQQIQFLTQSLQPYVINADFAVTTLGADALTANNGLYYALIEHMAGFSQSQIALGKSRGVQVAEADEFYVMTSYDSSLSETDDHFQNPFTLEIAQAQGLRRSNKIFRFNAQEHIYFLPNGMMAYRLNGGAGTAEVVAPNDVVINTLAAQRQLDPTINIGSCMGCHFEPTIRFNDQLRRHISSNSAFNALEKELGEVFFDAVRMEATLRTINQEHQDGLRKLGVVGAKDPVHENLIFPMRSEQNAEQVCGHLLIPTNICLQRIRGSAQSSQIFGNLLNGGTVSLAILSQNFNQLVIDTQAFRDGSL